MSILSVRSVPKIIKQCLNVSQPLYIGHCGYRTLFKLSVAPNKNHELQQFGVHFHAIKVSILPQNWKRCSEEKLFRCIFTKGERNVSTDKMIHNESRLKTLH